MPFIILKDSFMSDTSEAEESNIQIPSESDKINNVHQTFKKALSKQAKAREITAAIKTLPDIQEIDLTKEEASCIVNDLDECFLVNNFIKTDKGKKFLGNIFLLQIQRLYDFTKVIKTALQNTQDASSIGEICVTSWINSDIHERALIETVLLKNVIEWAILAASPTFSKNCRLFLESFHTKRRRNELSSKLVHLYEPVIFRYLHAANPIVRVNTLLLFSSAFPLESKQFSGDRNLVLLKEQLKELQNCLSDESAKVRATAAKSVCRVLYEWWELFENKIDENSSSARNVFIRFLTEELCFDTTSPAVRTSVIEGIDYLIGRYESIELILPHLPKMGNLLHDPVESVRLQFIKLLTTLNPLSDINIFMIVHIDHLIYRLKNDSLKVASAICELLQPSIFPPPSTKGKERTCNTKRVARCIFMMERNLVGAERFYSLLPKYVSSDEILYFIKFAYFWYDRTINGKPPKLPVMKLVESEEEMALPAFKDGNDLERLGYEPHQAIWVIIASLASILAKKSKSDLEELKQQTFPDFDARKIKESLPVSLQPSLFKFISNFQPTEDEIGLALEYLENDESEDWSEALRCLMSWDSLSTFFPDLVQIITTAGQEGMKGESSIELTKAIRYLSFIFSNGELRKEVIEDIDSITKLSEGLNKFLTMLLIKLNLPFDGFDEIDDKTIAISNELSDICYVKALELIIALRVHLSIQILRDETESNDSFNELVENLESSIFTPIIRGIVAVCSTTDLEGDTLQIQIFRTLMTLYADLMALHVFDGDPYCVILGVYTDCISGENNYGDEVRKIAYECLAKIVLSNAIDYIGESEDDVPQAKTVLIQMFENASTKECAIIVRDLIESLVKNQLKKRCMPWLKNTLSDLYVTDDAENEEEEENANEVDEDDPKFIKKKLAASIADAIVKL